MLSIGTVVLGNYRVERILQGGMGLIYVCSPYSEWDRSSAGATSKWIAIKTMRTESYMTQDNYANYQREIAIAGSLPPHPYLIDCLQVTGLEDVPGIVLPYATGGTLRERISSSPLPLAEVVNICRHLCVALSFLHSMDIVHRDIKPENVLFTEEGNARIADFGLAGMQTYALSLLRADKSRQIPSSRYFIGGTLPYMSPEQFGGGEVTPRSDVYSFGVLFHELLVGRVPATVSGGGRAPSGRRTVELGDRPWPRELRILIERCLQESASNRFADFGDVERGLVRVAEEAHLDLVEPARPSLADLESRMTASDWSRRGTAFSQLSRRNDARICHERAYELAPREFGTRLNLGKTLLGLGEHERGLHLVEQEVEENPDEINARLFLAKSYARLGRWADVVYQCEKAIILMPNSLSAHRELATALRRLGEDRKFENTIDKIMKLMAGDPLLDNPVMWVNGGMMFGLDGELRASAKFLEESVRRFPNSIDAWHNLAATRTLLRDFHAAVYATDQVFRLSSEPVQTWFLLGFVSAITDGKFGSIYYWGELVGRFPDHLYGRLAAIGIEAVRASSGPEEFRVIMHNLLERSGYLYFRG